MHARQCCYATWAAVVRLRISELVSTRAVLLAQMGPQSFHSAAPGQSWLLRMVVLVHAGCKGLTCDAGAPDTALWMYGGWLQTARICTISSLLHWLVLDWLHLVAGACGLGPNPVTSKLPL